MSDVELQQFHIYAYIENCFNNQEIDLINSYCDSTKLEEATVAVQEKSLKLEADHNWRKTDIQWFDRTDIKYKWLFEKLVYNISSINYDFYNFDITVLENLQYSVYKEGHHYIKHADVKLTKAKDDFQRKLSFTLQLSDESEYEGGELLLYNSEFPQVMQKRKGTLTVFPSYILHEVRPVTRGIRKALVGWALGKDFR